jgi:transposase
LVELGRRVVRRRRRTVAEKIGIIQESRAPGSSVAEVAHRHAVNPKQVYTWRRQLKQAALGPSHAAAQLLEVRVSGEPRAGAAQESRRLAGPDGRIEITLADGVRIAISGAVGAERLEQVLGVLRR